MSNKPVKRQKNIVNQKGTIEKGEVVEDVVKGISEVKETVTEKASLLKSIFEKITGKDGK